MSEASTPDVIGPQAALFREQGFSGLAIINGQVKEEFIRSLEGKKGVQVYKEMSSNDPIIGGFLHAIYQSIRRISWTAKSEGDSNAELEAANFIEQVYNDMSMSWPDTLTEILSELPYGWSYFEKVYKIRKGDSKSSRLRSKYDDGRIGIRKLAIRSQEPFIVGR